MKKIIGCILVVGIFMATGYENGMVYAQNRKMTQEECVSGNMEKEQIIVTDTEAPEVNLLDGAVYKHAVEVMAADADSEIETIELVRPFRKTLENGEKIDKEGKYELLVRDKAGNERRVSFQIAKSAKSLKVSYAGTSKWNHLVFQAKVTGTKRKVVWKCDNKKIASIQSNGRFRAKKNGSCTVTAKIDGFVVKKQIVIDSRGKCLMVFDRTKE